MTNPCGSETASPASASVDVRRPADARGAPRVSSASLAPKVSQDPCEGLQGARRRYERSKKTLVSSSWPSYVRNKKLLNVTKGMTTRSILASKDRMCSCYIGRTAQLIWIMSTRKSPFLGRCTPWMGLVYVSTSRSEGTVGRVQGVGFTRELSVAWLGLGGVRVTHLGHTPSVKPQPDRSGALKSLKVLSA